MTGGDAGSSSSEPGYRNSRRGRSLHEGERPRLVGFRAELLIDSRIEEIARAREWLTGLASAGGFSDKEVRGFGLVVSEACANIVKHAYRGQSGNPIELRLAVDETSLVLKIQDEGERFDLESYSPPDLGEPHEGGYGVFIMRSVMDEVHYDTSGERGTTLTLVKRRSVPQPEDGANQEGEGHGR